MREEHENFIKNAMDALRDKEKISHVYFTACGGSQAVLMPGQYILDKNSNIPSHVYTANEFIYDTPKNLNENAVVITCSHSGNTPETVTATKLAREKGALTISLSNEVDSPLWEETEYPIHYDWGPDANASDLNKGIFYAVVFNLLNVLEPSEKWTAVLNELPKLNDLTIKTKEKFNDFSKKWCVNHKRDDIIYT